MTGYVALLRGINVGGKNFVRMAELKQFFSSLGFVGAQTLLQSGNVVFQGEDSTEGDLESQFESEAKKRLGLNCSFIVRKAGDWRAIVKANPFIEEAAKDPSHLVVVFLKHEHDTSEVRRVQAALTGPEAFKVVGREVFVWYPEGIGTSKVGSTPGWNKLMSSGTGRNWNTVLKLKAMLETLPSRSDR